MPEHRDDGLFHGADLDKAMDRAKGPEGLGICISALESRRDQMIEGQLRDCFSDESVEACRQAMAEAGESDPDPDVVLAICARTTIGGSFTFGIAVGMELERMKAERDRG